MISRSVLLALLSATVLGGTLYSVINHTYLDTSDPLISRLPHPLHHQSIFAQKTNIFNSLFVKKAWGWTSAAFVAVWLTSPPHLRRTCEAWLRWAAATAVWGSFAAWFFGPSVLDRFLIASGGSCVLHLPPESPGRSPVILTVPVEHCYTRATMSPSTHPTLFSPSLVALVDSTWTARPRLYSGHDVSGHIFLLTISALFLHNQLQPAWKLIFSPEPTPVPFKVAVAAASSLFGLWLFMTLATSIYWHTPLEKITGFGKYHPAANNTLDLTLNVSVGSRRICLGSFPLSLADWADCANNLERWSKSGLNCITDHD
jgi:Fat storage-inducing transmembrane protein